MTDIKITTEEKKEPELSKSEEVKQTLKALDEIQKLKEENDKLELEIQRREELRARMQLHGRAEAGTPEKSEQQKAEEEAAKILKTFR